MSVVESATLSWPTGRESRSGRQKHGMDSPLPPCCQAAEGPDRIHRTELTITERVDVLHGHAWFTPACDYLMKAQGAAVYRPTSSDRPSSHCFNLVRAECQVESPLGRSRIVANPIQFFLLVCPT